MKLFANFLMLAFFCLPSQSMEPNDWTTWTPKEIAAALTKLNSKLMQEAFLISPTYAFLNNKNDYHAWYKLADFENRVLSWCRAKISNSSADPAVAYKFFQIATELYDLNNFNSLLTIIMALLTPENNLQVQLSLDDYVTVLALEEIIADDAFCRQNVQESLKTYLPQAGKVAGAVTAIHSRHEFFKKQDLLPIKSEEENLRNVLAKYSQGNCYGDELEARPEILNFFSTLPKPVEFSW
jgi:hypothetical protein